ncbi:MAG: hypothetical protein M3421_15240 [Bacteroidota bacterium]|nr:hypothetical protein [Bacteroidota bacterium]
MPKEASGKVPARATRTSSGTLNGDEFAIQNKVQKLHGPWGLAIRSASSLHSGLTPFNVYVNQRTIFIYKKLDKHLTLNALFSRSLWIGNVGGDVSRLYYLLIYNFVQQHLISKGEIIDKFDHPKYPD